MEQPRLVTSYSIGQNHLPHQDSVSSMQDSLSTISISSQNEAGYPGNSKRHRPRHYASTNQKSVLGANGSTFGLKPPSSSLYNIHKQDKQSTTVVNNKAPFLYQDRLNRRKFLDKLSRYRKLKDTKLIEEESRPHTAPSGILKRQPLMNKNVVLPKPNVDTSASRKVSFVGLPDKLHTKNTPVAHRYRFQFESDLSPSLYTSKVLDPDTGGLETMAVTITNFNGRRTSNTSTLSLAYSTSTANQMLSEGTLRANQVREQAHLDRVHCIEHRLANQRRRRAERERQRQEESQRVEVMHKLDTHLRPTVDVKTLGPRDTSLLVSSEVQDLRNKSIKERTRALPRLTSCGHKHAQYCNKCGRRDSRVVQFMEP